MNSEELEQSLRAEFESYLKGVLAEMRGDVNEFQKKIEDELEKHRSQLDEAFRGLSARFAVEPEFDGGFKESVVEHLRLARDEGAKITATAIAEAEELEKATSPVLDLHGLNEAVNDISTKDSQSSILRSLIYHASKFTPRGAFFIIKNEHFVGWKVFGNEAGVDDAAVRDIHYPVAADSILGGAVRALSTVEGSYGTYSEDGNFLDPLNFGRPDRMYAIPLVARGRGVAVLYADYGHEGVTVNTDALEMLVRIAGLTVELLASSKAIQAESHAHAIADFSETHDEAVANETAPATDLEQPAEHFEYPAEEPTVSYPAFAEPVAEPATESVAEPHVETAEVHSPFAEAVTEPTMDSVAEPAMESVSEPVMEHSATDFDYKSSFDVSPEYPAETFESEYPAETFEPETAATPSFETVGTDDFESTLPVIDADAVSEQVSPPLDEVHLSEALRTYEPAAEVEPEVEEVAVVEPAMVFDSTPAVETTGFEPSPSPFDQPVERFEPAGMPSGGPIPSVTAPAVETVGARPMGTRLSDRNVDLPIEVAEDERRLHNDARRFARLLVSEIKLYNEKKVQEGRESSDLYERLREAIDRSREMYDKRVQPPVAAKFDYFHFELVNSLAEGNENCLGPGYPGAKV